MAPRRGPSESETRDREPLAIVGIGCRFPGGASSPGRLWKLLLDKVDAVGDVPPDRWDVRRFYDPDPDKPGRSYARRGAFLQESIHAFDPTFFGISPREAEFLDPQQRLLLEATWDAFEDAGLQADRLRGSDTGVFVGGFTLDAHLTHMGELNRELMNSHVTTGSSMTLLSARLAYTFDLRGPCLTMDTACSSSLVATHYASQSLWNGECDLAVIAGVNVLFRPEYFVAMSKGRFLSPDGCCRAFDDDAAGYVRGEGAGVVVVKPWSAARADGDPVYALIRATGVNQDGQTRGITAPSAEAQERLIRRVYAQAGVSPGEVSYVEAHGTGTRAGDPVEARALDAALREGRAPGHKCVIGSIKTNFGHMEAAAGVAGLIKAALCLRHGRIPAHLHFRKPNRDIPFDEYCIEVATEERAWPANGAAFAGVNSFGYGGTNAHVLLEGVRARGASRGAADGEPGAPLLLPVSAKDPAALSELAERLAARAEALDGGAGETVRDLVHSAVKRRTHHERRLTAVAATAEDLSARLRAAAAVPSGEVLPPELRRIAFVYTGMGPQWWGMGRELMRHSAPFRQSMERLDQAFREAYGWSVLDALGRDEASSKVGDAAVSQPANFMLQVALTELWRSWGIEPGAVVGHSVGEVAAAYVAGALSLDDALLVSRHRSRLQQLTAGQGTMLAVGVGEQAALELIGRREISVAAINGHASTTLAGARPALEAMARVLEERGVFHRFLRVDIAYHSHQMEPIRGDLLESLGALAPGEPTLPLYSTVTGARVTRDPLDAEYWWQNVRSPVRLRGAVHALIDDGYRVFLEVGPHPVLRAALTEGLREKGVEGRVVSSLDRKQPELETLLRSLGDLFTLGLPIDWDAVTPTGRFIPLPQYPWQREHYHAETEVARMHRVGRPGHPLLSQRADHADPSWQVELSRGCLPFLPDHRVRGSVVVPGALYVEAALATTREALGDGPAVVRDLAFERVLTYDARSVQRLTLRCDPESREFSVHSRSGSSSAWVRHATGRVALAPASLHEDRRVDLPALLAACGESLSVEQLYDELARAGLEYGPSFRTLRSCRRGPGRVLIELEVEPATAHGFRLPPMLLDGVFQSIVAAAGGSGRRGGGPFVPVAIRSVAFHREPGARCWCSTSLSDASAADGITADALLFSEDGEVVAELTGILCRAVPEQGVASDASRLLHRWAWEEAALPSAASSKAGPRAPWLVLGATDGLSAAIKDLLSERDVPAIVVVRGDAFERSGDLRFRVGPDTAGDLQRVMALAPVERLAGVLYLWGAIEPAASASAELSFDVDAPIDHVALLTQVVQALEHQRSRVGGDGLALGIVTRRAQAVSDDDPLDALETAPLWSLGQLVGHEHPWLRCTLIDVARGDVTDAEGVLAELSSGAAGDDVALRDGVRFLRRLMRGAPDEVGRSAPTSSPLTLRCVERDGARRLAFVEARRRPPGPGEVEVAVHQLLLPGAPGHDRDAVVEADGSGTVVAVGDGARGVRPGDHVSFVAGAAGSYVTLREDRVTRTPEPPPDQALVLRDLAVAWHALVRVARLAAGERLVVRAPDAPLGLAAARIGAWLGATVEGEDPARRGGGADVVFDAVGGDGLVESLRSLAPGGSYLLARSDAADVRLPLDALSGGRALSVVDPRSVPWAVRGGEVSAIEAVGRAIREGELEPLHVSTRPASEAPELLGDAGSGRLALRLRDVELPIPPWGLLSRRVPAPDGTYLITGGTSGFGLEIARWLAGRGAGGLVLVSRRGAATPEVAAAVRDLEEHGARVLVAAADIGDRDAVERLIATVRGSDLPPLRGVIHGAAVLDDAFLRDMDRERYAKVMSPKVGGAIHLHRATLGLDLELFVCLSSVSSIIGNVGQASYVAANGFLDALAHYRRQRGLPATTINLGALKETGIVSRNDRLADMFTQAGVEVLAVSRVLCAMAEVLPARPVQLGIFGLDLGRWARIAPKVRTSTRFAALIEATGAAASESAALAARLDAIRPADRPAAVREALAGILSELLHLAVDKVSPHASLADLGIDSLATVELQTAITSGIGVELPAMELLRGPTVDEVGAMILGALAPRA